MNALTKAAPRWRDKLLLNEDLNFLLTNRVPRRLLTQLIGWFSKIRSPRLTRLSIWVWRQFTELDLSDASKTRFDSLHDCFTRELRAGARPVVEDEKLLASPVDCLVGAVGCVEAGTVLQAKGMPYRVAELLGSEADARLVEGGSFLTLRLSSAMYHRFHAPCDARIEHVRYLSGDTWNVNPIALARIERLFCRNERAPIRLRLIDGAPLFVVPVAAILVASIRFHFLGDQPYPRQRGATELPCEVDVQRGQELGWFEHGSTLVLFVPPGFEPLVQAGQRLRMGEALLRRATPTS